MMNPNTAQNIMGAAYVQKLDVAARAEIPFANYDVLTPDESLGIWKVAKSLLSIPSNFVSAIRIKASDVPDSILQNSI